MTYRTAELPVTKVDWRGREITEDDLTQLSAAERQGINLSRPPLMRLAFIRTDDTRYRMIWTCHHLLLDGWSNALLLAEVPEAYATPAARLAPPAFRFRDHVAWLEARDAVADERFWRQALKTLDEPTSVAEAFFNQGSERGHGHRWTPIAVHEMAQLSAFARREKVTLNTLVQAAWLLTLKRFTGRSTVSFGVTVAGRPPEMPGVETALGLFINTIPVVASIPPNSPVGDWLRALQTESLTLRDHEHAPLAEIQRWANRGGRALFDNLLVFENYPVDRALRSAETAGLRFGKLVSEETTNYPLTLSVFSSQDAGLRWSFMRHAFARMILRGWNGSSCICLGKSCKIRKGRFARSIRRCPKRQVMP